MSVCFRKFNQPSEGLKFYKKSDSEALGNCLTIAFIMLSIDTRGSYNTTPLH